MNQLVISRLVILLMGATGVATGCRPDGGARDNSSSATDAETQELIVAAGADEFGLQLNRHRIGMYPLNASICEPPFRLTAAMTTEPALATRAEYRGNTLRLTLRKDVRFHDGSTLSAASVKSTLDREIRLRTQYSFLTSEGVNVVNDSTIELRSSVTNLRLVEQLVHPTYGIVADGTDPTARPVCTGPFRFAEYIPHRHITVERNENYWGPKPKLKRLTFRFIPDDNARALALRAGEVDAIFDVNRNMIAGLSAAPGIRIVTSPPGAVMLMYISTKGRAPFTIMADPAVRRAVAMAIDRNILARRVLSGYAQVVSTVNPPSALGRYAALIRGVPYDPAGARALLDAAGWSARADGRRAKDGRRLNLVMILQPGAVDRAVAEYIQAQLLAVGVTLRIDQLDPGAFQSRINAGTFDLDIEMPNQNDANPAFLLALRWYSGSSVRSAPFMAIGPRFDSLVAASLSAIGHEEARRSAGLAMHELVDVQVGAIPLAGIFRIYALSSRVRGFEPHPSRASQWWNTVWVER